MMKTTMITLWTINAFENYDQCFKLTLPLFSHAHTGNLILAIVFLFRLEKKAVVELSNEINKGWQRTTAKNLTYGNPRRIVVMRKRWLICPLKHHCTTQK